MDNPYLFQMVKDRADIVEVAERFGLSPDTKGWCACPFHREKTPSFHLYHQRYRCFGCGAQGDVIDLVAALEGVGPLEAARRINGALGLGLDLDAPVDPLALAEAEKARRERARFKAWREGAVSALTERFRYLHTAKLTGASLRAPDAIPDWYAAALKEIDTVEYYLDLVVFGEEAQVRKDAAAIDGMVWRVREERQI